VCYASRSSFIPFRGDFHIAFKFKIDGIEHPFKYWDESTFCDPFPRMEYNSMPKEGEDNILPVQRENDRELRSKDVKDQKSAKLESQFQKWNSKIGLTPRDIFLVLL
jgi:hypothetical protein